MFLSAIFIHFSKVVVDCHDYFVFKIYFILLLFNMQHKKYTHAHLNYMVITAAS